MKFTAALALAMTVAYAAEVETETETENGFRGDPRALGGLRTGYGARVQGYRAPVAKRAAAPQSGVYDYQVRSTIRPRDISAYNVLPVDNYYKGYKADETIRASCEFDFLGYSHSTARAELVQKPGDLTSIIAEVEGMQGGLHGFKIHEFGDLEYGCKSTGDVYNPYGSHHGNSHQDIRERRVGDIEQLQVRWNATGDYKNRDALVMLSGPNSVIGRSMVIYERKDDHDMTEHPATYERDARIRKGMGERVACCVIGLAKGEKKLEKGVPPASTKLVRPTKAAPKLEAKPKIVKAAPKIAAKGYGYVERDYGYDAVDAGYGYDAGYAGDAYYGDERRGLGYAEAGYGDYDRGYGGYNDGYGSALGGYGGYGRGGW